MSHSDDAPDGPAGLGDIATRLDSVAGSIEGGIDATQVATISAIMASAVRLYSNAAELSPGHLTGAELAVTPTEAVTVAAALLRSQQLTPFEFSIWFSQTRAARGMEEFEDDQTEPPEAARRNEDAS